MTTPALALRGVLLLTFGLIEAAVILLAFRVPHITSGGLVVVVTAFLLLDAVACFLGAAREPGNRPWLILQGLASLVAGVLFPVGALPRGLILFAWWAIVIGVLEGAAWVTSRRGHLAVSVLSLLLGVGYLVSPVRDPARVLIAIAAYAILAGFLRLTAARAARG